MTEAGAVADVMTGAMLAREAERLDLSDAKPAAAHAACANCRAPLAGPYCAMCGQAGHVHRTLVSLGHDLLHGVFHFEGKLGTTLPLLVLRPGELTRRYIAGERAKFVSPIALFLFSVFMLFASIQRLDLPDVAGAAPALIAAKQQLLRKQEVAENQVRVLHEQRRSAAGEQAENLDRRIAAAQRSVAELRDAAARVPARSDAAIGGLPDGRTLTLDTGWKWFDRQALHVRANPALYAYKLQSASYKYSWALIPISLPFIWAMFFWRRDVGLYDHAIFATYSLASMTLLAIVLIGLALLGVSGGWLWLAMVTIPPLHIYKQLRGAYLLGRFGAAWRTVLLLAATMMSAALFLALLVWLEAD